MSAKYLAEALVFLYIGYRCLRFALRNFGDVARDRLRPVRIVDDPGPRRIAIGEATDRNRMVAHCPACGAELGTSGEVLGLLVRCPACRRALSVRIEPDRVLVEVLEEP